MARRPLAVSAYILAAGLALWLLTERRARLGEKDEEHEAGPYPSDWFGMQRAFPGSTIPQEKFELAVEQARFERALAATELETAALVWEDAGPYNIGGRVTGLAVAPGGTTVYVGAANGGVFKSTDSGVHWSPIFDAQAIFSIGALALDPGDPDRLYVGTGEANSSIDSYDGVGLFRTPDGGVSWESLGLEATRRIARVVVDPKDPSRIFVAAMGAQFSAGPDRGLYLSEDSGANWTKVLSVNDSTGACDVAVNPAHSDTVFAATWERLRRPASRRAYGPGSGVWRSVDSGHNWTRLAAGLPAPSDSVGRLGLAIAPSRPSTIYALIIGGAVIGYQGLGMYRSSDGGDTWVRRDTGTSFVFNYGGFGWYFGDVAVDPADPNKVYSLGVELRRSTNGGTGFASITGNAHVDMHALWIDPTNPLRIYVGSDGGFFSTSTGGAPWFKSVNLPITQFYACAVDPANAGRLMGGTQDNNTLLRNGSAAAWTGILGGDGFQCSFDPLNPGILFAEYQFCSGGAGPLRSSNGGSTFATPSGFAGSDRYNWNSPLVMGPSNHDVLLAGSQRVWRSTDNGLSYAPISADLTTNPVASIVYGTITTLDISPVSPGVYYAGTDDGRVWRSIDAGGAWQEISAGLPVRWVTRVTADRFDGNVVYVTLSGFGIDEELPHVYRSADRGDTWEAISSNLPDIPANDIIVDSVDSQTLYLATDVGPYATRNRGASWFPLGTGMPVQTVFDLALHAGTHTLVAATHGRGMWTLDLAGLPSDVALGVPAGVRLSPPAPNPSRGPVSLQLEHPGEGSVEVAVYDASGRRIRLLHEGRTAPGARPLRWDGSDHRGMQVAAGVYFVRAEAGGAIDLQRIVRIR